MAMNSDLKDLIKRELPGLLRDDPALRDYVIGLTRDLYADRRLTDERFDRILEELRNDRIAQSLKWEAQKEEDRLYREEQNHKWDEQNRKWDEQVQQWHEQNRKWDEQTQQWREQNRKWDEQKEEEKSYREEQNRKFEEVHQAIMAQAKKFDRSIGALGARWGIQSEQAFRNALAGILEESFGVEVINVNEYDDSGEVFGRPEQVELDVIIKNGTLLICELKSSIDKAGMYIFERKARFYEKRHGRKANRLIVISPMIDAKARKAAHTLGIDLYSDSSEVEEL